MILTFVEDIPRNTIIYLFGGALYPWDESCAHAPYAVTMKDFSIGETIDSNAPSRPIMWDEFSTLE